MEEVKTWQDLAALSEEDRASLSPGEMETLKNTVAESESKLDEERKAKDEEATKNKELADNYKVRAEKAESKKKEEKPAEEPKVEPGLSQKDMIIIAKSDVHEDDLDEVIDYAKYKDISVAEALKTGVITTLLQEKNEERETAQATQTKGGHKGSVKQSEESIIEKARKGQEVDPEKVAEARMALKLKRVQNSS